MIPAVPVGELKKHLDKMWRYFCKAGWQSASRLQNILWLWVMFFEFIFSCPCPWMLLPLLSPWTPCSSRKPPRCTSWWPLQGWRHCRSGLWHQPYFSCNFWTVFATSYFVLCLRLPVARFKCRKDGKILLYPVFYTKMLVNQLKLFYFIKKMWWKR